MGFGDWYFNILLLPSIDAKKESHILPFSASSERQWHRKMIFIIVMGANIRPTYKKYDTAP